MQTFSFTELIGVWEGDKLPILDFSLREIYQIRDDDPETDGFSNVDGWQKLMNNKDTLQHLKLLIHQKALEYCNLHEKVNDLEYTSFFANINGHGASNCMHHHNYGEISGVFWLKAPRKSGDLIIMNPYPQQHWNTSLKPKTDRNALVLTPKANHGVFFNSNLVHYVDVNRSDNDRVSVGFHLHIVN
jgi:uncharacterized protein (TIGR02466 family)